MATIPVYQSQNKLEPAQWDPKVAGEFGKSLSGFGNMAEDLGQNVAEHIKKVQDLNDRSKAIIKLSDLNDATHDKYRTDPDLSDASQRAQEELEANMETAFESIKSPGARNEFQMEAMRMKDSKQNAIDTMIQGRVLQQGKNDINNRQKAAQQEFNYASSPSQEADVKKRFNSYVDERIQSNGVNTEWAEAHRDLANYNFGNGKLLNDIAIAKTPQAIDTIKTKAENGDYGQLRDVDLYSAMIKADRKSTIITKQIKKQQVNIQERNARDLDLLFRANDPNLEQQAEEKYFTGQINKATFDSYTGGDKKSSMIDPDTNGSAYMECVAMIADQNTKIADVRNYIMDKYNQQLLSPHDRNKLYDLAIRPMGDKYKSVQDVIGLEESKKDESQWGKNFLNSALNHIHDVIPYHEYVPDWTNRSKVDDKALAMTKRFIQKIMDGNVTPEKYIQEAHNVVKEQNLIDRPEIASYPEGGRTEQDEDGNRSVTTPYGDTDPDDDQSFGDKYGG